jgi:hypothetical protein
MPSCSGRTDYLTGEPLTTAGAKAYFSSSSCFYPIRDAFVSSASSTTLALGYGSNQSGLLSLTSSALDLTASSRNRHMSRCRQCALHRMQLEKHADSNVTRRMCTLQASVYVSRVSPTATSNVLSQTQPSGRSTLPRTG